MPCAVEYVRNEVRNICELWLIVRDAIEGEPAIKAELGPRRQIPPPVLTAVSNARKYLPQPNPSDNSQENAQRYRDYVARANWHGFTARTLDGMVGQIFLRPPVSEIPDALKTLVANADGEGLGLEQVAKRTVQSALAYGRAGLLTDYPVTSGAVTADQQQSGEIRPIIRHYYPWQVINWGTVQRGAKRVLSMVVLAEPELVSDGPFEMREVINYRVLRLTPDFTYTVEVWRRDGDAKTFSADTTMTPKDSAGKTFDEIPFTFVGSEANDLFPDRPPLYDLASLNVAHYRNSADFEESCFQVGQPTPVVVGVTESWVEQVLKGAIRLGSRGSISLPVGANAFLLQASPNQMPLEAMKAKEEQAVALGAKLVQRQRTMRTAVETLIDSTSESSTLHNVAKNTSAGIEQNLRWACRFAGVAVSDVDPSADDSADTAETTGETVKYQLNTEFELARMNANDRLAIVKLWQSGAIAFTEMRNVLRVDGTAQLEDDEAMQLIQQEQAAAATLGGAPIADPFQSVTPTSPSNLPKPGAPAMVPAAKKPAKKAAKKATKAGAQ